MSSTIFVVLLYVIYFPLSITIISSWYYNYWTYIFVKSGSYLGFPLSVELRVDGLSIVFLLLVAFLVPMVVLISSIRKNISNYAWHVVAIELILISTFLSFSVLLFFFSFEMVLLLMCFLVSTWGGKLYKIRSSFYLFVFTVFGSVFFLICAVTLLLITGSNSCILDWGVNLNQQISFALLFTVALGIKVPVFPFHLWLPEVHSETDTSGSVLLAGVLLKLGSYGLIRFTLTLFPVGYSYWSVFIFVLALFGSLLGSINCLTIYDIKQIIA